MPKWQLVWRHWWKVLPSWKVYRERAYEDLYPNLELYKVWFFFSAFQLHYWTCRPPLPFAFYTSLAKYIKVD